MLLTIIIITCVTLLIGIALHIWSKPMETKLRKWRKEVDYPFEETTAVERLLIATIVSALTTVIVPYVFYFVRREDISVVYDSIGVSSQWAYLFTFSICLVIVRAVAEFDEPNTEYKENHIQVKRLVPEDFCKIPSDYDSYNAYTAYNVYTKWMHVDRVQYARLKEINQHIILYRELTKREKELEDKMFMSTHERSLYESAKEKKKTLQEKLNVLTLELGVEIDRVEGAKERKEVSGELARLLGEKDTALNLSERIDIQELTKIAESKTLPSDIIQEAERAIEQIQQKENLKELKKQQLIDDAEATIQAARLVNRLKEEREGE